MRLRAWDPALRLSSYAAVAQASARRVSAWVVGGHVARDEATAVVGQECVSLETDPIDGAPDGGRVGHQIDRGVRAGPRLTCPRQIDQVTREGIGEKRDEAAESGRMKWPAVDEDHVRAPTELAVGQLAVADVEESMRGSTKIGEHGGEGFHGSYVEVRITAPQLPREVS